MQGKHSSNMIANQFWPLPTSQRKSVRPDNGLNWRVSSRKFSLTFSAACSIAVADVICGSRRYFVDSCPEPIALSIGIEFASQLGDPCRQLLNLLAQIVLRCCSQKRSLVLVARDRQ